MVTAELVHPGYVGSQRPLVEKGGHPGNCTCLKGIPGGWIRAQLDSHFAFYYIGCSTRFLKFKISVFVWKAEIEWRVLCHPLLPSPKSHRTVPLWCQEPATPSGSPKDSSGPLPAHRCTLAGIRVRAEPEVELGSPTEEESVHCSSSLLHQVLSCVVTIEMLLARDKIDGGLESHKGVCGLFGRWTL